MKQDDAGRPRIFYLVPDFGEPSWGLALLYHHVGILREHGFEAWVLHQRTGFSADWLGPRPPVRYLDEEGLNIRSSDFLVVPEILAAQSASLPFDCRRIVFVQGAFLIFKGLENATSYRELGFEAAMAILPHIRGILRRHFEIPAELVPPFIADYFFEAPLDTERKQRILLFPKKGYRDIGYFDFDILQRLLQPILKRHDDWETVEVRGLAHREVARLMGKSAFAVNLNCLEAFNTTVPEAMAAGCIPVCYEAFGGRDFLVDGVNAFVFRNNDVFRLAESLEDLMEHHGSREAKLAKIRSAARNTAAAYNREATAESLLSFFASRIS